MIQFLMLRTALLICSSTLPLRSESKKATSSSGLMLSSSLEQLVR